MQTPRGLLGRTEDTEAEAGGLENGASLLVAHSDPPASGTKCQGAPGLPADSHIRPTFWPLLTEAAPQNGYQDFSTTR